MREFQGIPCNCGRCLILCWFQHSQNYERLIPKRCVCHCLWECKRFEVNVKWRVVGVFDISCFLAAELPICSRFLPLPDTQSIATSMTFRSSPQHRIQAYTQFRSAVTSFGLQQCVRELLVLSSPSLALSGRLSRARFCSCARMRTQWKARTLSVWLLYVVAVRKTTKSTRKLNLRHFKNGSNPSLTLLLTLF